MIKLTIEQQKKAREIGATHWDSWEKCFRKCGKRYLSGEWRHTGLNKAHYHKYPEIQPIDFSALDEQLKLEQENTVKLTIEQLKLARQIGATHWDIKEEWFRKCGKRYLSGEWRDGLERGFYRKYPDIQPIDFSELDEQLKLEQENKVKLTIEQLKKARQIGATHWDSEGECFRKDGGRYLGGEWIRGIYESRYYLYPEIQPIDFSELDDYQQDKEFDIAATGGEDDQMPEAIGNKYMRQIKSTVWVDVYDVISAWKITNPAQQHLVKKALQAGERGHKDYNEDMDDVIASASRAKQLENNND